jgi:thiol-disulfide isomerase/thioredoxin
MSSSKIVSFMALMKKYTILFAVFVGLILAGGIYFLTRGDSSSSQTLSAADSSITLPTNYEYFWGDGCPHCKNVADFLSSWENADKVNIEKFEVWNNIQNAKKMEDVAAYCKIPKNELAVPLLFTPEGKCLIGDGPIINLFKEMNFDSSPEPSLNPTL